MNPPPEHAGGGWLGRVDPLTKLVGIVALAVWGMWGHAPGALGLVLAIALSARLHTVLLEFYLKRLGLILVLLFVFQGFLFQGESEVWWSLGPISVKTAGLDYALTLSLRLLIFVGLFLLLTQSTPPRVLGESLEAVGMPGRVSFVLMAALQLEQEFKGAISQISAAQQARGVDLQHSMGARVRALLPFIGTLVGRNLRDIEGQSWALAARGFPGKKPTRRHAMRPTAVSWFAMAGFLLITVAIFAF